DDKDARSYRLLGDAYGFWGRKHFDPKKGEKFLLKAIEIDKNYAAPHGTLVDMFLILKKYDKAEKHLRAFLNLIPADQQTAEWCQDAKAELRKNGIRIL
ncbi:MAG: hypothetical protein NTX57_00790, partial [Armatimonadetes bacterium]|nr:hypothetical protein [Armatimonadota bacterium]